MTDTCIYELYRYAKLMQLPTFLVMQYYTDQWCVHMKNFKNKIGYSGCIRNSSSSLRMLWLETTCRQNISALKWLFHGKNEKFVRTAKISALKWIFHGKSLCCAHIIIILCECNNKIFHLNAITFRTHETIIGYGK